MDSLGASRHDDGDDDQSSHGSGHAQPRLVTLILLPLKQVIVGLELEGQIAQVAGGGGGWKVGGGYRLDEMGGLLVVFFLRMQIKQSCVIQAYTCGAGAHSTEGAPLPPLRQLSRTSGTELGAACHASHRPLT